MATRTPLPDSSPTILLVTNSPVNVEAVSESLRSMDSHLVPVADVETAVRLANMEKPDLVLLDLAAPTAFEIQRLETLRRELADSTFLLICSHDTANPDLLPRDLYDYVGVIDPSNKDATKEIIEKALVANRLKRQAIRAEGVLLQDNQDLRDRISELERTMEQLQIANESLKESSKSRASFFSLVAHELRHPLAVAKGYLELITSGSSATDQETRGFVEIAERNLLTLAKMLDDLLDLSRIEAGGYKVDIQPERLNPLVSEAIQAMAGTASAKSIELAENLQAELPLVSADALRIVQVLCNLIENACKFSNVGGLVTISAEPGTSQLEVIVEDTGVGMAQSELEKIFEPFYQIKSPALPSVEGAGLGLAICREIVRLHGGQIWATSELRKGSRMHFTLPLA